MIRSRIQLCRLGGCTGPAHLFTVLFVSVCLLMGCSKEPAKSPSSDTPPAAAAQVPATLPTARHFKILHVMSYHSPWEWTDIQLQGFKDALAGMDVELRVFQLDAKRHSSVQEKQQKGREALELVNTWKPDLIYTSDDDAQVYVTKPLLNGPIPVVFSGVNAHPSDYGFDKATNVSGVLELEHFTQSLTLLRQICPGVKRLVVVTDHDPMWNRVIERMKQDLAHQSDVEVIGWEFPSTFQQYQQVIKAYEGKADAEVELGVFGFADASGKNVDYRDVRRWTAEHSRLPEVTLWRDRVPYGALCTVTVSGYEQGLQAGQIARGILLAGKSPSSFPMQATVKGEPVISLARAKVLGIQLRSDVLLSAQIVKHFRWDEPTVSATSPAGDKAR